MELLDYEKRHIEYLEKNGSECTLFLKHNSEFPILDPCKVVLVGNGARNTIKGGTGSGDVASRYFKTIEEAMEENGFTITSKEWLDRYDEFKKTTKKDYIKDCKEKAKDAHILSVVYSMGFFEEEKDYDFNPDYEGDICIYVLARNSGEGNDRRNIKGDVKLSNKEIEDILYLNNKFKKFMLVLNVGGVIDLTPVLNVSNILLLSQLGVVTGNVLCGIILGKYNPSGKLTTTWARPEDYPYFSEFGDRDDTYYKEGIYVGYRYFNTVKASFLFPFGYGLSYTDFDMLFLDGSASGLDIKLDVRIWNLGRFSGKEVIETYLRKPNEDIDNPSYELVSYKKTKELEPGMDETLELKFNLGKFASFDQERAIKFLPKGDYYVFLGTSVRDNKPVLKLIIKDEIILEKLENKCISDITDYKPDRTEEKYEGLKEIEIEYQNNPNIITYKKDEYIDKDLESLSDEELAYICTGNYGHGIAAIVGESCKHVVGGAGETTLKVPSLTKSLTMADGPAGLRLITEYGVDKKGVYNLRMDPMMEKMLDFLPKILGPFIKPPKHRHGEIHHQYTTAIPIGTALAQSFNDEFVEECGKLVQEEMEIFKVDLWLAPALNIHRNILCGRNFEYFSEDPYLSGMMASAITRGVERDKHFGVTIKHYAGNNQEFNRNNNNSHISERALREIYLKGFEICIKDEKPKAIMTSYNLINGVHTSESFELINDILRCEWGYSGLVMTDWIASGRSFCKKSIYPAPYASNNILAGNDLTMSGCPKDHKDIMKALKSGELSRTDLLYSASRIYRSIKIQKEN